MNEHIGKREVDTIGIFCCFGWVLTEYFALVTGFDYKTCNVIQAIDLHNPDDDDNWYEGQENEEQPARDLVSFWKMCSYV